MTDTLIVASIDPVSGDVALISFPRDIARFPTPDGHTYQGKINSLMTYANNHPKQYPNGGLSTLVDELGYLLGSPINYYAAVDLDGFSRLIDAVGGITVDNPRAIDDPTYTGWKDGHRGLPPLGRRPQAERRDRPRLRPFAEGRRRQRLQPSPGASSRSSSRSASA